MGRVSKTRYVDFRVVDINGNPVAGLHLSDFTVYFTRNGVPCSDPIILADKTNGRYLATYVPSSPGFDFLELYNAANDIRRQDAEMIDTLDTLFGIGGFTAALTQDYGGVGMLKVTQPFPQTYTLYVFKSQDWQSGSAQPNQAINATQIDATGNWITSPLIVAPDTYHIVAMNGSGTMVVISAFLQVVANVSP